MTARLSTSKSTFVTYFLYRLREMKGKLLALCLLSVFSFPLLAVCADFIFTVRAEKAGGPPANMNAREFNDMIALKETVGMIFVIVGVVCAVLLFIEGFFLVKSIFRYLYDKKYVDMKMSVPADHNIRFFGDVLTGLVIYIAPQIITVTAAQLILFPSEHFADAAFYYDYVGASTLVRSGGVVILCASVLQLFFTLAVMSLCGRKLTANIVPVLFGIGVPGIVSFLNLIVNGCAYGIDIGNIYSLFGGLFVLPSSPLGMVLSLFFIPQEQLVNGMTPYFLLCAVIYSALYCAAAYFLIKYRRAERTGSAFVYRGGRYATQLLIMLGAASLIFLDIYDRVDAIRTYYTISNGYYLFRQIPSAALIGAWFALSLISFAVIELVSGERLGKPKKLLFSALRFVSGGALSFLICLGFAKSDGFGAVGYIPAADEVASVDFMDYMPGLMMVSQDAVVDGREGIQKIMDFHRAVLAERPEYTRVYSDYSYDPHPFVHVGIRYNLTDGSQVARYYYLPDEYAHDAIKLYFDSGAFASKYRIAPVSSENESKSYVAMNTVFDEKEQHYVSTTTDIPYSEFREAVMADAAETTYDDILRSERVDVIYVRAENGDQDDESDFVQNSSFLTVYTCFGRTMELFKQYGVYDLYEHKFDRAVKFFIYTQKSVGAFTSDMYYDFEFIDETHTRTNREFREISEEQAKELLEHSSFQTVYEQSRDVYLIMPVYEYVASDGKIYYTTDGLSASTIQYVTEPWCDRAAQIYAAARRLTDEDMEKYLPDYR